MIVIIITGTTIIIVTNIGNCKKGKSDAEIERI